MTKNIAIVFAGGVGTRMGVTALPKQFIEVHDKPILIWALEYFSHHPLIDEIYLACKEEWLAYAKALIAEYRVEKIEAVIPGGVTAQHSIYNALQEARKNNTQDAIVLIHDGVRPFITDKLITTLIEATKEKGNAITYTPCQETIVVSEDGEEVNSVPIRRHTLSVQAPQAFYIDDIISAHDEVRKLNPNYDDIVDACTIYDVLGRKVNLVRGNIGNIKITRPEDVYILKGLMEYRASEGLFGISLLEE